MTFLQTTLRAPVALRGVGMHTGQSARVRILPAEAHTGIRFRLGGRVIPARAEHVASTRRCTSLERDGTRIQTVEHVLSALAGLQVDNAIVEVEGPEIPILDGSALPWVEAVREAGIVQLDASGQAIVPPNTIAVREGGDWMAAWPADSLTVTCVTHFDHPLLGIQACTVEADPEHYAQEIAPARTFGFIEEVEALHSAGLALGGSLENALVIYPDRYSSPERVPQECLRHKMLDLIGDLSLAGGRIQAVIAAIKPSHTLNLRMAARLAELAVGGAAQAAGAAGLAESAALAVGEHDQRPGWLRR